jgi:prolyl 4-hydroxylase
MRINLNIICKLLFISVLVIILGFIIYNCFIKKSKFKQVNLDNFGDKFYFEIEDVLTNEECDLLINKAKDKLINSKVMDIDKNNNYIDRLDDKVRTSKQAWLEHHDYPFIKNKTLDIVNKYLKYNKINSNQFESIQVANYKTGGEYKEHYDICHPDQAYSEHLKTCKKEFKIQGSVRFITVIYYLNDGFNGGETHFPKLNISIKPKKGKALIFFNCNLESNSHKTGLCNTIDKSQHAGMPVLDGGKTNEKWIANVWIRVKNRN